MGVLTLGASNTYTGGTAYLNFTGDDIIAGLTVDGMTYGPGIYNSSNLVDLSGTGSLEVVPEPATWALMAGGLLLLACGRRRRA